MATLRGTRIVVTAGLCAAMTLSGALTVLADPVEPALEDIAAQNGDVALPSSPVMSLEGDGTEEKPYLVSNADDLAFVSGKVNAGDAQFASACYKLVDHIDLSGREWVPIGVKGKQFAGTFDGSDFTVSGLTINNPGLEFAGLFGIISGSAKISNITIRDASIVAKSSAGALVGNAFTGTVEGCNVVGSIKITACYKVGGLAGEGYTAIKNCAVSAGPGSAVVGTYKGDDLEGDNVGGLVGFRGEGAGIVAEGCSVSNLKVEGTRKVGGLIGSAFNNNIIKDCSVSNVDVVCNATLEYASKKVDSVGIGGVVGLFTNNGSGNGELKKITVDTVSLSVSDSALEEAGLVSCGYVSGGQRGAGKVVKPAGTMAVEGVLVLGENKGESLSEDLKGDPAVSGSPDATKNVVAVVDGKQFESLQAAVDAAEDGQTVKLVRNMTLTDKYDNKTKYGLNIEKSIILDGAGFTIDCGSFERGIRVAGGSSTDQTKTVAIKNVKMVNNSKAEDGRCVDTRGGYLDITFDAVEIDASGCAKNPCAISIGGDHANAISVRIDNGSKFTAGNSGYAVLVFNPVDMTIDGESSLSGYAALYLKGQNDSHGSRGSKIVAKGSSMLASENPHGGKYNDFGTIVFEDADIEVTIDGAILRASATGDAGQAAITFSDSDKVDPHDNSIVIAGNSRVEVEGKRATFVNENKKQNAVKVSGGTFNVPVEEKYCAEGFRPVDLGNGKYGVEEERVPPVTPPSDKIEVEHNDDGSTTTTVTKPDGSQTVTHETATGTESVVKKDKDGNVTSTEVTVSKKDAESGRVELPIDGVEPATDAGKAPEVEVKVPSSVTADKPVQVTVPVAGGDGDEPDYGIVVFAVDEDGNEVLIPKCAVDDDGNVVFEVSGDVTIRVVDNAKGMADVKDTDWFAGDVVDFATARGIVNGVPGAGGEPEFRGDGAASRAMVAAMLHNLELAPSPSSPSGFGDVDASDWYADAAAWGASEGIVEGHGDGSRFGGEEPVTREQLAVFLMRYAAWLGMDTSARAELAFPDAGSTSPWAREAMEWAVAEGLFSGYGTTGELRPGAGATRAQVATVLRRFVARMYE